MSTVQRKKAKFIEAQLALIRELYGRRYFILIDLEGDQVSASYWLAEDKELTLAGVIREPLALRPVVESRTDRSESLIFTDYIANIWAAEILPWVLDSREGLAI